MMENGLAGSSEEMNCCSYEGDLKSSANDNIGEDYEPLYEVEEDEDCGRYLVASQNIDQGQVILFEKPTGNSTQQLFFGISQLLNIFGKKCNVMYNLKLITSSRTK